MRRRWPPPPRWPRSAAAPARSSSTPRGQRAPRREQNGPWGSRRSAHCSASCPSIPLRRTDRILVAPPLFHAFASGVVGAACLIGCTIVLSRSVDPETFEQDVRAQDLTAAALVPVMVRRVLDHDPLSTPSPLRLMVTSGSAFNHALRDAAQDRWGKICYDLYGSTEAGWVAISTPDDFRERRGTVGRPGHGIRVAVTRPRRQHPARRRDRHVGGPHRDGVRRIHRGRRASRRMADRRPRLPRRRRLPLRHGPARRDGHLRRREHLPERGRGGVGRSPRRRRVRGHRGG